MKRIPLDEYNEEIAIKEMKEFLEEHPHARLFLTDAWRNFLCSAQGTLSACPHGLYQHCKMLVDHIWRMDKKLRDIGL